MALFSDIRTEKNCFNLEFFYSMKYEVIWLQISEGFLSGVDKLKYKINFTNLQSLKKKQANNSK